MTNAQIRHLIYSAIGFLILFGIGWYFLAHPSKLTEEYIASEICSVHQDAMEDVCNYLLDKDVIANITGVPSIDNSFFHVPTEDSDAYRRYHDGVVELMRTVCSEIIAREGSIQFVTPPSGGLLNQDHAVIVWGDAPPILEGAPKNTISGTEWSYYIVTEKD